MICSTSSCPAVQFSSDVIFFDKARHVALRARNKLAAAMRFIRNANGAQARLHVPCRFPEHTITLVVREEVRHDENRRAVVNQLR
jgi:hypothetical protein